MRILVTGHLGYLGRHLVPLLKEARHEVIGLDLCAGVDLRLAADVASQAARWGRRPDAVMHLAALCDVRRSVKEPLHCWLSNVAGTANLLDALRWCGFTGRFVFASSCAAQATWASPYGATKAACEVMLAHASKAHGLSAVCLRLFNLAGGHDPTTPCRIVPAACRAARDGTTLELAQGVRRDFVHVEDAARAFVLSLDVQVPVGSCRTLDVGSGRMTGLGEVCDAVQRISGKAVARRSMARPACDPPDACATTFATSVALGWDATHDLDAIVRSAWQACCLEEGG